GFLAQLVDGTLGMAYGVLSNTALMAIGLPPAPASALVHTAEVFTTSASAASHIYHRNVDWRLVGRLGVTGVLGAILGAWILSNIEVSSARRFVYAYLLIIGCYILWKSLRIELEPRRPASWTGFLGFAAGFLDASGGGRVGTDDHLDARRLGARAALFRRLGQYRRILRDCRGGHHVLCGNRCGTAGSFPSARHWRRASRAARGVAG